MNVLKYSFLLLFFSVIGFTTQAQDAETLVKDAGKALKSYYLDPSTNEAKLTEAHEAISTAFDAADLSSNYKALVTKSKVYSELMGLDFKKIVLANSGVEQGYKPKYTALAADGVSTIEMALKAVEKKYQTKEVLSVLAEMTPFISTIANALIGSQSYSEAYAPLKAVIAADKLLTDNDQKSVFENDEDRQNQNYVTAVCALQADDKETGKMMLEELARKGSKEPQVYSNLFSLTIESDEAAAMKYLDKGRELDPENSELLFAEINYYIKEQRFDILEDKLKQAIAKDPENPSIYSALGNVYMNLSQSSADAGDAVKEKEYFDSAMSYFEKTIELDDTSFDAVYSIGSLYFNKAATITKEMQDLGMSKEDQKRFEVLGTEAEGLFETALPYFKKSEILNPNDRNTVIALKEIMARMNDFDKSNEFKKRLEVIDAGGQVDGSFFK